MTTRLLRVVNSPFYGFPSRIDTVSRAVTVVGTGELLSLVLAASVVRQFRDIPPELIDMQAFWRHSVYCAVVARVLAARRRETDIERYFVAGLIHDVGSLILYKTVPRLAAEALVRARDTGEDLPSAERTVMGCDHADVGAELMNVWRMPPALTEVVAYHHAPERAVEYPREVATVHLADIIAGALGATGNGSEHVPAMVPDAWAAAGFPVAELDSVLSHADDQFNVALELIMPEALVVA